MMPEASKVTFANFRRALRGQWAERRPALLAPPSLAGAYAVGGAIAGGWFVWFGTILAAVELVGVAVLLIRATEQDRDAQDLDSYFRGLINDRTTLVPLDLEDYE